MRLKPCQSVSPSAVPAAGQQWGLLRVTQYYLLTWLILSWFIRFFRLRLHLGQLTIPVLGRPLLSPWPLHCTICFILSSVDLYLRLCPHLSINKVIIMVCCGLVKVTAAVRVWYTNAPLWLLKLLKQFKVHAGVIFELCNNLPREK